MFYGTWMFGMVLLWDLAVALTVGNQAVLRCFERSLPWLERGSGAVLILSGGLVLGMLLFAG